MKTARLLLPLLALLLTTDADAITRRKACRLACGWKVDQCIASGVRRLKCRRRTVRDCKLFGLGFCVPPTTTTTTTTLAPVITPTTSTIRVTTTTVFRPPTTTTTSTTLPTVLNAAGVWTFSGTLVLNDCDLDANTFLVSTIQVRQSGTALTGFMGTLPAAGDILDSSSWQMLTEPSCNTPSCCSGAGIQATEQRGDDAKGAIAIVIICTGGVECTVGYTGLMAR